MLDGGIIQKLLEEKWKTFARVRTFKIFFINFIVFKINKLKHLNLFLFFKETIYEAFSNIIYPSDHVEHFDIFKTR